MPGAVRLDHVLTYTDAPSLDDYLQGYRAAGFQVAEQTARHGGGLRNGFVGFGSEYLELLWVEDEARFATGHPRLPEITRPEVRRARRPFGIGLVSDDVRALHDAWVARGYELPPVFSEVPPGAPPGTPPALSIQIIPPNHLPGVLCFALTYHFDAKPRQIVVPPNTAYAIGGVSFVSDAPDRRARQWRDLLDPAAPFLDGETGFALGPHRLLWLTPAQYEQEVGRAWHSASHPYGELALLHLFAEDLDRAEAQIERAGMSIIRLRSPDTGEPSLLVGPGPRDGFVFAITRYPVARWADERRVSTGEQLEVEAADARSIL